jgi:hypothetical protein
VLLIENEGRKCPHSHQVTKRNRLSPDATSPACLAFDGKMVP